MRFRFYLQPGKRKAKKMYRIWDVGCMAEKVQCILDERVAAFKPDCVPVFYGVAESTVRVFNYAVRSGRPWVYIDNQYFPTELKKNYRITWNAVQHTGIGETTGKRLREQMGRRGLLLGKWNTHGKHILITLQSELYFQLLMPYSRQKWLAAVVKVLKKHTDRPIIVREKPHPRRPYAQRVAFEKQLVGCHAIVTLNSATAIEGILRGIPAFVTDPNCAIIPAASNELSKIEQPEFFDRENWLGVLADNQWSPREIESGRALRSLMERTIKNERPDIIQRTYKLGDIK